MVEVISDINTYISIKHRDGSIPNEMQFLYAKTGYGKSLAFSNMVEEYHRAGFTILILSDVKDEFEMSYSMFEPIKPYHVMHLNRIGKPIGKKKVKVYHPFTFALPTRKLMPNINLYSFPIKDMGRREWSMIAESAFESDTIRVILNTCRNMENNEGLYSFMHSLEASILGIREDRKLVRDWKQFGLKTTPATAKSLGDAVSYMLPFKQHYFLQSHDSDLKLRWDKILKDREHYHTFSTYWIKDEKIKEFTILALFNAIIRNKSFATNPVLIAIPEIRFLVPFRPEGYKKFLANGMKANLSIMRSQGKGMSGLFDSQVWTDVDDNVRNSASFTVYGELGGAADIEKVSKAMGYKRETRDQLKKMQRRNSYLIQGLEELETFTMWFPSHMHSESEYNFFDMYKKHYSNEMVTFTDTVDKVRNDLKFEENLFKDIIKKKKEKQDKIQLEKKKEKEKTSGSVRKVEEAEKEKQKIKTLRVQDKEDYCYDYVSKNPEQSLNKISKNLKNYAGFHRTVVIYCVNSAKRKRDELPEELRFEYKDSVIEILKKKTKNQIVHGF